MDDSVRLERVHEMLLDINKGKYDLEKMVITKQDTRIVVSVQEEYHAIYRLPQITRLADVFDVYCYATAKGGKVEIIFHI